MLERTRAVAAMTALLVAGLCGSAQAAAGDLDPSFAQDGRVSLVTSGSFVPRAVAVAPDGRILVGGYSCVPGPSGNGLCQADGDSSFRLARFTPDGGLDSDWGDRGIVTTRVGSGRSQLFDLLVQPDGRVVAAGVGRSGGRDSFVLARFDTAGALDRTFGSDGVTFTPAGTGFSAIADLAPGPAGTIVAVGQARDEQDRQRMAIARYSADGALDGTFGTFGTALAGSSGYGYALGGWVGPDGAIHAAGLAGDGEAPATFRTSVARLDAGGAVMRTEDFPTGTSASFANALAGLPDGRWLTAGAATDAEGRQVMALLRGGPGEGLDPTWDDDGVAMVRTLAGSVANDLVVLADGRVLAAGQAATGTGEQRFALARLDAGGRLDRAFGGGVVTTAWERFPVARATALAVDAQGRALVAGIGCADGGGAQCEQGTAHLALTRHLADPPPPPPGAPPAAPAPARDTRPPAVRLTLRRSQRVRSLLRSGLRVGLRHDEAAALRVTLRHRRRVLSRRTLPLAAGPRAVRLKPSRRRLGRSRSMRLQLEVRATDGAGNVATLRRNIRVRR